MKRTIEKPLLDFLSDDMRCLYLSDLEFMKDRKRIDMAGEIQRNFPAESASLFEWNDALSYLTGAGPEKTAEAAREKLIQLLKDREGYELCVHCGRKTNVLKTVPISERSCYIEGAGQLCEDCYKEIYDR